MHFQSRKVTLVPPRIIKRYPNRKLYDTEDSRYIKLKDIAGLVQSGVDVKIIDNQTQEDLTGVTLAQLLLDAEKRNERALPLNTLTEMLRTRGTQLQKSLEQQVSVIKEEAERKVEVIRKGTEKQFQDLKGRTNLEDVRAQLKELISQAQVNLEDLHNRVEDTIRQVADETSNLSIRVEKGASESGGASSEYPRTEEKTEQRLHDLEQRVLSLEHLLARLAESSNAAESDTTS
tara:strand:- start:1011 stop:1709 length:699 start_codon:yes stop_codon:yes gene_type:complete